jgi:hypothetical protein
MKRKLLHAAFTPSLRLSQRLVVPVAQRSAVT